jgi:hypothetical protein
VHYRFMDYRKDSVSVLITVAGGEILETAETAASRRRGRWPEAPATIDAQLRRRSAT